MNNLIKKTMPRLKLLSKYTSLTKEEIEHTATCAYYFNKNIKKYLDKKEEDKAIKLLCKEYWELVKHENSLGYACKDNKRYDAAIQKLISLAEDEYYDMEYEILSLPDEEILKKVRNLISEDDYSFLLFYYSNGNDLTADIYGISKNACRKRVSRMVKKIRDKIGGD